MRYGPAVLLALLMTAATFDAAATGATIQVGVGPGFGDAQVDAPPASKVFGLDKDGDPELGAFLAVAIGGSGFDLFGVTKYRTTGDFDPWNAFSIQLTNMRADPQPIEIQVFSDIVPTASPSSIELHLEVDVRDTNASGTASFDAGTAFSGAFNTASFSLVPFAVNNAYTLAPGAPLSVIETIGPGPDFTLFGATTVDQLFMAMTGTLSAGDTLELNGFQCIYVAGGACPTPPDLRISAVPEPSLLTLLLSGCALLFGARRSRRVPGS